MTYYRQCTFQNESSTTVAWVPEAKLKVGVKVTFKDEDDGRWWTVVSIGETRMPEEEAKKNERAYLHQRKASDI